MHVALLFNLRYSLIKTVSEFVRVGRGQYFLLQTGQGYVGPWSGPEQLFMCSCMVSFSNLRYFFQPLKSGHFCCRLLPFFPSIPIFANSCFIFRKRQTDLLKPDSIKIWCSKGSVSICFFSPLIQKRLGHRDLKLLFQAKNMVAVCLSHR